MMIQDLSFYIISILAVLILSALVPLALKKYFVIPVLTFVGMILAACVIPNFIETTNCERLKGYAGFLGILSLLVSILTWFYTRGRRKRKELDQQEMSGQHAEDAADETHGKKKSMK